MKLKVKGACTFYVEACGEGGHSITIQALNKVKKAFAGSVPVALEQQINLCTSAQELMTLLFQTPAKDEAVMAAFDRQIEELEALDKANNIHSLKTNNHGSTTHTTTAS